MRKAMDPFESFVLQISRHFRLDYINRILKECDAGFKVKYNRKRREYFIFDGRVSFKKFPVIMPDIKDSNSANRKNGRIYPKFDFRPQCIVDIHSDGWVLEDGAVLYHDKKAMKIYRVKFRNAKPRSNIYGCMSINVNERFLSPAEAVNSAMAFNPDIIQVLWSR